MTDANDKPILKQSTSIMNMSNHTLWVAHIPVKLIDSEVDTFNFNFNIASFTLGAMELGVNEIVRDGIPLQFPSTSAENTNKEIRITYKMSSEWQQYYFLWKWWQQNNLISEHVSTVFNNDKTEAYLFVPMTVYLLNEMQQPIMKWHFENCWLKMFGELTMDYQEGDQVITHDIVIAYQHYNIELVKPK